VFTPPLPAHPVSTTFSLGALTTLIEWMSHGMEYVTLSSEAIPALHTLLAIHAELAEQQRTPALEGGRA
jgi:hypothetical protein